jgi:hypothetical protein
LFRYVLKEKDMARNKRPYEIASTPITLDIEGTKQTKSMQEWCYHFEIPYVNARMRYTRGKRGADIFKTKTEGNTERHIRQRFNHNQTEPLRKYTTTALLSFLPAQHHARFIYHTKRLGISEEQMLGDAIGYVLNRLDKQEQKAAELRQAVLESPTQTQSNHTQNPLT